MRQTPAQYRASLRNLKHARAALRRGSGYRTKHRRVYHRRRGGNPLAFLAGLNQQLKAIKPFSQGESFLNSTGIKQALDKKFGNSGIYKGLKSVGNFLTGTLGYGRRRRRAPAPARRARRAAPRRGRGMAMARPIVIKVHPRFY